MSFEEFMNSEIASKIDNFSGVCGIHIQSLDTPDSYSYNLNEVFPTASEIKLFVLTALLKKADLGDLDLGSKVTVTEQNKVGGSGLFKEFKDGAEFTLKDAAMAMTIVSDNTATNICIDALGGPEEVNSHIVDHGMKHTRLGGRIDLSNVSEDPSSLGVTTPYESVDFVRQLIGGQVLSKTGTALAFDILRRQQVADQFPRFLPYSIYAPELGIKQDLMLAHKTGYVPSVRTDVGYIKIREKSFVYGVLSKECADDSMYFDNEASVFAGEVGASLYRGVCEFSLPENH